MKSKAFDSVIVHRTDGSRQAYSVDEFMALPLDERVGLILARSIDFYLGDAPVARREALKSLRV